MPSKLLNLVLIFMITSTAGAASATGYIKYPFDDATFKKYPKERAAYLKVLNLDNHTVADVQSMIDSLLVAHKNEPAWEDGYWMMAERLLEMGTMYSGDDKSNKIARTYFSRSNEVATKCLELGTDNPWCMFYKGASKGKIATVDGVLSSLVHGRAMLKMWMTALDSKYNHVKFNGQSFQGDIRYALGMFYRLVPDFIMLKWFFGIKGDIKKSVSYHQESVDIDKKVFPCRQLMLGVSLICSTKGDLNKPDGKKGANILMELSKMKPISEFGAKCISDSSKIVADPGIACGYTKAKIQDMDTDKIKK